MLTRRFWTRLTLPIKLVCRLVILLLFLIQQLMFANHVTLIAWLVLLVQPIVHRAMLVYIGWILFVMQCVLRGTSMMVIIVQPVTLCVMYAMYRLLTAQSAIHQLQLTYWWTLAWLFALILIIRTMGLTYALLVIRFVRAVWIVPILTVNLALLIILWAVLPVHRIVCRVLVLLLLLKCAWLVLTLV